jgi:ribosomal-protein-alanine N-acetyltransferase
MLTDATRRTQICSKRNSNRINPAKNFVPLKSTISESHNRNAVAVETLLATSPAGAGKTSLRQALSGTRTGPRSLLYHPSSVTPHLQTSRLLLRPLELADAAQAQLLFPHWEIVRYLANVVPWPYPADGAHTYYRDAVLPAMARGEAWHWTLRLKTEPDRLIGCIALLKGEKINRGFWLGLPWHGQGLMTEACEAVTDYWFNTLKFQVLRAPKAAANVASCRISERSGMRLVAHEEHDYVAGRLPTEIWEITAEEWNAGRK